MTPAQLTGSGPWSLDQILLPAGPVAPGSGYYDRQSGGRITYTDAEIAALNAPPPVVYPPYVIAPTPAKWQGSVDSNGVPRAGTQSPVDPRNLSTFIDAEVLALNLGIPAGAISNDDAATSFTPNGETRQLWTITFKGVKRMVGDLIAESHTDPVSKALIIFPMHWDLSGPTPVVVSDAPAPVQLPPPPMQQLDPTQFQVGRDGPMGDFKIFRVVVNVQPGGTSPATGSLTASQDARLANIERLLIAIGSRFGVS